MLDDDDLEELLLLIEDWLELADDRLDELLEEEVLVLLDVVLDEAADMDDMLLDVELVAMLELDDAMLTVLDDELGIELDGCDEVSDELPLMFPEALDELTAPDPPVHADVIPEIADMHATASASRSLFVLITRY